MLLIAITEYVFKRMYIEKPALTRLVRVLLYGERVRDLEKGPIRMFLVLQMCVAEGQDR